MKQLIWDLTPLLRTQKELDEYILTCKGKTYDTTFSARTLALIVELSELANETKVFKFWSNKVGQFTEKVLEEYVDCLHFSLSLVLHYNCNISKITTSLAEKLECQNLVNFFLYLNNHSSWLLEKEQFIKWFQLFLTLGLKLGFKQEEIFKCYFQKAAINFERQRNKY